MIRQYMKNNRFDVESYSISTDVISLLFVGFLLSLTIGFAEKVPNWENLSLRLFAAGVLYLVVTNQSRRLKEGWHLVLIRSAAIIGLFAYLFDAVDSLQHIIVDGWMDDALLAAEHAITGTESAAFLQQFINPALTEGMMFTYVIYTLLLPLVAFICYWSQGMRGANDYLLNLAIGFVVCFIGFILFPVASPLYHAPQLYSVPLDGGLFTWCGEWIRQNQHYAGGSLPSPHCTAATTMLLMMYRHNRKCFFVALPTILMLFVSTVYGRYHYVWDGIVGILCALCVVKYSPKIVNAVNAAQSWINRTAKSRVVLESTQIDTHNETTRR